MSSREKGSRKKAQGAGSVFDIFNELFSGMKAKEGNYRLLQNDARGERCLKSRFRRSRAEEEKEGSL